MQRLRGLFVVLWAALASGPLLSHAQTTPRTSRGANGTVVSPNPAADAVPGLKMYQSRYYDIYTDLPEDGAREAMVRMTQMAEEYHRRTEGFSGVIRTRLPFYLFSRKEDYYKAGGIPNSAGVFSSAGYLMAMSIPSRQGGPTSALTWHVVQHEGFHQFVHAVIGGEVPIWVNEGLAEYFGEGIFTGDGFVSGVIPERRLKSVKAHFQEAEFKAIEAMMKTSPAQWNAELSVTNYDQAWSMVHFLAHAENGKYQRAFSGFMNDVSRGANWDRAWLANFGSAEGFEKKWREYWEGLPDDPTADLYVQATVAQLTSFLARATSKKQTFDSIDEFLATDPKSLKADPKDWLPPALFASAAEAAKGMQQGGVKISLVVPAKAAPGRAGVGGQPQVVAELAGGAKLVGHFTLRGGQVGEVKVDLVPLPKAVTPVRKPAAKVAPK